MTNTPENSIHRPPRDLSPRRAAATVGRAAGRVSAAALSTAKTSVLRRDRATDDHHAARLGVCGNCPGGHAVLGSGGAVRTCGPMLASLTVEGKSTCGCVLDRKARDVKQACPFGYWEEVDRRAAWESVKPRAVVAGLSDLVMSRRAVLGGTLAAGASLMLTQKVQAAEGSKCYIPITPCDQGDATHIHCSKVEGMAQGDSFRNKADDNCYKIAAVKAVEKYEQLATGVSGDSDGCEDCGNCIDCGNCSYTDTSTVEVVVPTITYTGGTQIYGDVISVNNSLGTVDIPFWGFSNSGQIVFFKYFDIGIINGSDLRVGISASTCGGQWSVIAQGFHYWPETVVPPSNGNPGYTVPEIYSFLTNLWGCSTGGTTYVFSQENCSGASGGNPYTGVTGGSSVATISGQVSISASDSSNSACP